MQGIDQDRQIGFPGVARPDEYGQRTQINLGLDDRPRNWSLRVQVSLVWLNRSYLQFSVPAISSPSLSFASNPPRKRPPPHLLKGGHLGRVGDRFVAPGSRAHVVHGIAPAPRTGPIGIALVQRQAVVEADAAGAEGSGPDGPAAAFQIGDKRGQALAPQHAPAVSARGKVEAAVVEGGLVNGGSRQRPNPWGKCRAKRPNPGASPAPCPCAEPS